MAYDAAATANVMTDTIPVAVLGFSPFERSAIVSYFGLNPRRSPSYEVVTEVDAARLVVADADLPGVGLLVRTLGRTAQTVFVGDHAPAGAGAWMMRPISPAHLLREMDALLVQLENPGSDPLPLSLPGTLGAALTQPQGLGAPLRRAADAGGAATGDGDLQRRGLAEARRRLQAAVRPSAPPRRALLVDDSDVALVFLRRQLARYGIDADLAHDADDALTQLARQPYAMVFVDLDLGEAGMDGLMLCQQIRHRARLAGPQPVVTMVSAFHDPVDQVRGTLAGADAYLGKPLDAIALDRLMAAQGHRPAVTVPHRG